MEKQKVIRLTLEFDLSQRKAYANTINEANELAVYMAVTAFLDTMPAGSIVRTRAVIERFDLFQRTQSLPYQDGTGTTDTEVENEGILP